MADGFNGSGSQQFKREPAVRAFALELTRTSLSTGKEEGADRFTPVYSFSPSGAKINRVFVCGTLTEVEEIGTDSTFLRARLVDPTGAVGVTAGQYQPEVASALRELADKLPAFVAVLGKLNIYRPSDGGVFTTIRAESIQVVPQNVRDFWIVETAKRTTDRIRVLKEAMASGKVGDELKGVLAAYSPDINDLKNMVRAAIDKSPSTEGKTKTNGDGGGVKDRSPKNAEQARLPEPSATAPPAKPPADKSPAAANAPAAAAQSSGSNGFAEEIIGQAAVLLKDLCALSEDGTVGGNTFLDRLSQRKLASPDTAIHLCKALLDRGLVFEPKLGRLKAV